MSDARRVADGAGIGADNISGGGGAGSAPLRVWLLREAARVTGGDRARAYGEPVALHAHAAAIFRAITGVELTPRHVAMVLHAVKLARAEVDPCHADSVLDAMAYLGIAAECARAEAARPVRVLRAGDRAGDRAAAPVSSPVAPVAAAAAVSGAVPEAKPGAGARLARKHVVKAPAGDGWPAAREAELLALLRAGVTRKEIERRLRVGGTALRAQIARMEAAGVEIPAPPPPARRVWTPARDAELIGHLAAGMTQRQAGEAMGLSLRQVDNRVSDLRRAGVELPEMSPGARGLFEWTPALDARLFALLRAGRTQPGAARVMGVKPKQVTNRLATLRERGLCWRDPEALAGVEPAALPASVRDDAPDPVRAAEVVAEKTPEVAPMSPEVSPPDPVPALSCEAVPRAAAAPAPITPAPITPALSAVLPAADRALSLVLDAIAGPDWAAGDDLLLVEAAARGDGIAGMIDALGRGRDEVRGRWFALRAAATPEGGAFGIDEQARLLSVLRKRAEVVG